MCPESWNPVFWTFLIGSSSGRDDVKQVFVVFFFLPLCTEGPEGLEDGNAPGLEKETHLLQSVHGLGSIFT